METELLDKLKLVINDKNEITAYSRHGGIVGAIDWIGNAPDNFEGTFKPNLYILKDGEIIENPDYVEPSIDIPDETPNTIEQQVAALGYQQMKDDQDKQKLVNQNAQMAYQIMQIKQELGGKVE
jgi:hypothetical protein